MPGGQPFPMTIEPWPGGRWYRDLGHNAGHLWGHVQVIKPPVLVEICGPLMMSYPAANHIQYRLKPEAGGTRLSFVHRAIGLFLPEHRDGLLQGWQYWLEHVSEVARRKHRKDGFLLRRIPSLIANLLIRRVTGTEIHDLGCSLKVYRKELTDEMPLFDSARAGLEGWKYLLDKSPLGDGTRDSKEGACYLAIVRKK